MDRNELERALRSDVDTKTKPVASLGRVETLAITLGLAQGTMRPTVCRPTVVVFAADHGITEERVSPFPSEVTRQMVANFAAGGAAINAFCRALEIELEVVDVGVAGPRFELPNVRDAKVREGSRNPMHGPALLEAEVDAALAVGARVVADRAALGTNVLGFGEMGIGNTSTAALLASVALSLPIGECVGRGTGLDDAGLAHKRDVLEKVRALHGAPEDGRAMLAAYGGLEIAAIVGAMIACAERRIVIVVDGFIATSAFAVAARIAPGVRDVAVFAHTSAEHAHRAMLAALGARALLDLDMRLGEGTGAALAIPLLRAACAFLGEMASFESAGVSGRG